MPNLCLDLVPGPRAHHAHPDTRDEQAHHRIDQVGRGIIVFDVGKRGVGVEDHRAQYIGLRPRFPVPPETPRPTSLTLGSHAHRVPRTVLSSLPH